MDQLPTLLFLGLNWGFKEAGEAPPGKEASTSIRITPIPARKPIAGSLEQIGNQRDTCVPVLHNAQNFLWG